MGNITVQITEDELREVANAYQVLQGFLEKMVPLNELYTEKFLHGLEQAQTQVKTGDFVEVENFADFIQ